MERHSFKVPVKAQMCPVSMMDEQPEIRELIELQVTHKHVDLPLFGDSVPAWAMDFKRIVASADQAVFEESQELIARL